VGLPELATEQLFVKADSTVQHDGGTARPQCSIIAPQTLFSSNGRAGCHTGLVLYNLRPLWRAGHVGGLLSEIMSAPFLESFFSLLAFDLNSMPGKNRAQICKKDQI